MDTPKIIIIGAGLGGLECGYLLSKQGFNIIVVEQAPQVGGCLQSFQRKGQRFDTGFHYVGGLGEGEILHQFFAELDLLHLPWIPLDAECFDEIFLDGERFHFANGYDNFTNVLAERFPQQRQNLAQYTEMLRQSQNGLTDFGSFGASSSTETLLNTSAYQYLQQHIHDEKLRKVLSATSLKMDLQSETLPLYIFAQINGTFVQSAWRLRGGGQQIADTLADGIRKNGGAVLTNARVSGFQATDGILSGVVVNGAETFPCDMVISDIHPNALFQLLPEGLLRKRYQQRISGLQNSFGVFTVQLLLKGEGIPYRNRNIFVHEDTEIWRRTDCISDGRPHSIGVHFSVPEEGQSRTRNIDLFMPMAWSEVAQWAGGRPMRRGSDYEAFKQQRAAEAIALVEPYIPEIKGNIEEVFTSTPLTYHDYTATHEGSAYGICKDYDHLMSTMLPIRTPVPNLFLTGQNVNFHGVLGVTVTAKMTCEQIISALPTLS